MTKDELIAENKRLEAWIDDLQSGMYINCVYCGHRYGPQENTAVSMRKQLYEHIAKCPKHPLTIANAQIAAMEEENGRMREVLALIANSVCDNNYSQCAGDLNHIAQAALKEEG